MMEATEHFIVLDRHAEFRPEGEFSLDQAISLVTAAICRAREQNIRRLLVVGTGMTGFESPDLIARYFFMKEWARAARGAVRVALVARADMIDPQKFGVMTAANFGFIVDVFAEEEPALEWLAAQ